MPDLHNIRLPAGWYPDPSGADHRRWWDGKTWTQHTAPFQRPAPVYDVDDLIETKSSKTLTEKKTLPEKVETSDEAVAVPAPRRIRTAARLGRGLAALAHKLPFGLPPAAEEQTPAVDGPPPTPPAAPATTRTTPTTAKGRHRG
ncbi:DUF2510 domain-containing protein [Salinibacterium sp. SYSU T00001]|uniref:DUF2510 domain-containing protein n=1 Tax=Homoserinimonas sedimenticola TaxID=2986805 RepID=UPI00223670EB|nr:DUF2510 domain-containing protein [Salinibacterium sedimenticola]MCW4386194.1 DUF2510 domain-containing protein [Salinibacterium sedimenticola]